MATGITSWTRLIDVNRDEVPENLQCEHIRAGEPSCNRKCYACSTSGLWKCHNEHCYGHRTKVEPECFGRRHIVYQNGWIGGWAAVRGTAQEALPQAGEWALDIIMDFWPVREMTDMHIQQLADDYRHACPGPTMRGVLLAPADYGLMCKLKGPVVTDLAPYPSALKLKDIPEHLVGEHLRAGAPSCQECFSYSDWFNSVVGWKGLWICRNTRCTGHRTRAEPECFGTSGCSVSKTSILGERWVAMRQAARKALTSAGEFALDIMDFWPVRRMEDAEIESLSRKHRTYSNGDRRVDSRITGPMTTDLNFVEKYMDLFRWPQREHDL
ncbi:hypothetical protein NA57DRAFT_61775 [Rhizodiscina lignyota]|uniref:Uncharacterized protein n=1 Tax=Rhizodiscina lignyota TaxID=1504668 RepID=A0A9P4I4Z5_9PEZI|nr:hypothetical protein NA57DRAFT_61775 [Rhizodiscina lignyota]